MIEINLLPEELKTRAQKKAAEPDKYLFLIPLFFGLLLLLHLTFGLMQVSRALRLQVLKRQWSMLSPEIKKLEGFKKEFESYSLDGKIREELLAKNTKWSEKLNKLSLDLVPGVWFNEIAVGKKDILIKGSVVSLEKKEVDLINRFMSNLKSDAEFMKDFLSLDLGSVQKKKIGTFDVVDFSVTAVLKPK